MTGTSTAPSPTSSTLLPTALDRKMARASAGASRSPSRVRFSCSTRKDSPSASTLAKSRASHR